MTQFEHGFRNYLQRLSPEKKRNFFGLAAALPLLLSIAYSHLVVPQCAAAEKLSHDKDKAYQAIHKISTGVCNRANIQEEKQQIEQRLHDAEIQMAQGDFYTWMIRLVQASIKDRNIEITEYGTIRGPEQCDLLPNFPYQQISMSIAGNAYYNEIGHFLADFENGHKTGRIGNVTLDTTSGSEKLHFQIELIMLVNPNAK